MGINFEKIAREVRENLARLQGCPEHEFEHVKGRPQLDGRYRCVHCQGEISTQCFHWFMIGLKQGSKK